MATTRVVGLDIGTTRLRAAELEFGAGGPSGKSPARLLRFAEVPLPHGAVRDGEVTEPGVVSGMLRQMWQQAGFSTKKVVIGVGNQRVVVRELDLPWMPLAQLRASLPFQVKELLPMATDEALLDYYPTGEHETDTGRTFRGMLVAAQRDTVNANVLTAEGAGLETVMVDLNGFALLRSMIRGDLANQCVGLVDVGASITNIVIVDHGVPRLVRVLPAGGMNVTTAVASAMGIAAAEAETMKREIGIGHAVGPERAAAAEAITGVTQTLIEAIRNTFVYYQGNNPGAGIDVALLTGGGAHLPGFGQYLASASRLPVALGDPLAGLKLGKNLDRARLAGAESLVALSVGLAFGVAA
ncbi:type IV pilus assembly protein PilM [Pengzhenrongella frigida]|uniref:Type IV pilus assembly protein PilM n=1 Tax=Pengzhenrongella frigida TaxID=1259133 RepID=A0A4Q5N734_9MICO|nr:type IV pilus assembly protein PilM [Cellulomonas sp. HLT2-17]RYV52867.1 type IV pilus assembly protein PilM [Cellulomonas sp. HLT2-17]